MCIYVQNACIENEGNDKWASLCICSVITLCCYAYKLFILGMQMHFHAKCYLRNVNFLNADFKSAYHLLCISYAIYNIRHGHSLQQIS